MPIGILGAFKFFGSIWLRWMHFQKSNLTYLKSSRSGLLTKQETWGHEWRMQVGCNSCNLNSLLIRQIFSNIKTTTRIFVQILNNAAFLHKMLTFVCKPTCMYVSIICYNSILIHEINKTILNIPVGVVV